MIAFLVGVIEEKGENSLIIDVNGVGYMLNVSTTTLTTVGQVGERAKVFTYMAVREDDVSLFGFSTQEERELFYQLITVSGIGPKGALSILSSMTVSDIQFAVAGADAKAFAAVPGVGKKTAERAIIDLKDKVDIIGAFEAKITSDLSGKKAAPAVTVKEEVLEALVSLGYSASNAARALDKMTITESTTTEQLLSDTLKQMSFL